MDPTQSNDEISADPAVAMAGETGGFSGRVSSAPAAAKQSGGFFDDLVPVASTAKRAGGLFDDLVPATQVADPVAASSPAPAAAEWKPNSNDLRADGSQKGTGFLGVLKRPDGGISSELSVGTEINGKETDIPTMVPTLDKSQIDYLLNTPTNKMFTADPKMFDGIMGKAVAHAKKRLADGKSVFADNGESPGAQADLGNADAAFLAANNPDQIQQTIPGMIQVQKAIALTPEERKSGKPVNRMADDPKNMPSSDWMAENVYGPASVFSTVAPEYLKLAGASAMKFVGEGMQGVRGLTADKGPGSDTGLTWGGRKIGEAGDWITKQAVEMRDWADKEVVGATGKFAPAMVEMIGGIGGFSAAAAANPLVATALFSAGTGETLAKSAEQAGKTPDEIAHAREVGAAIGLAASAVPVTRIGRLLEGWNVNPFVKTVGQDLVAVMSKPDGAKRILAAGIEAVKSGSIGALTGAGFRTSLNAAENHFADANKPLLDGVAGDAAMFGVPMFLGGFSAKFIADGRGPVFTRTNPKTGEVSGISFAQATDEFAKRAPGYEVPKDGANPAGRGPVEPVAMLPAGGSVARPATGAAAEFERMAGMAPVAVPGAGPVVASRNGTDGNDGSNGLAAVPGGGSDPVYTGQNFVNRGGAGPVFQGGGSDLAGRTPMAALLPADVVGVPAASAPAVPVETDPARRLEIKNSIVEGQMILKSGRSITGRKLSSDELSSIQRSVDNAHAKLGVPVPVASSQDVAPAPAKRRKFSTDFIATGYTPVMDWVASEMPIRRSRSGKAGGENDDLPGMDSLRGFYRMVYSAKRGDAPDVVAQAAYERGLIKEPTANALGMAMHNEAETYRSWQRSQKLQDAVNKVTLRQGKDFQKDVLKPAKDAEEVPAAALQPGDKVTVGDETLTVRDIDPDSFAVTLEDGHKYGLQLVEHGQSIYVDEADLAGGSDAMDWPASDRSTAPESPSIAHNGEGNLFNNSDLPFNLQGETDLNPELQRAADARRASEDARSEAERAQGNLFGDGMAKPVLNAESGHLDLGAIADKVEAAGRTIYRKGMSFIEWARGMVDRLGKAVKQFLTDVWKRITGQDLFPWARERGAVGDLSVKIEGRWVPKDMAHLESIKPVGMPELIKLVNEVTGQLPLLKRLGGKLGGRVLGRMLPIPGNPHMALDPSIFINPMEAAKVIAHEFGHIVDFLPEETLKRGNILGRLGVLRDFLRSAIPLDPMAVPPEGWGFSEQAINAKERREISARAVEDLAASLAGEIKKILKDEPIFAETGVTPADIKELFMLNGRDRWPELYEWFSKLPDKVKHEIVKRAMRGILDPRAAHLKRGAGEQIGVRTVEHEVGTPGREATAEEILSAINAAMVAEMRSRNVADLKHLRDELIGLTDWWNPFLANADKMGAAYVKYRMSSKELYAEMISVLMNDPGALKDRAPIAWETFFNHLDKNPEAKRALFELWDWMNKPEYARLAERRAGVLGMFQNGAELMDRKIADKARLWTLEGFTDGLRTFLDTRYWPAIKRERAAAAKGDVQAGQNILEWMFDAHPLADNHVYLWLQGVQDRVRGPLLKAELTEENLGEFLMWDRIANERYEVTENVGNGMREVTGEGGRAVVANPKGHNPATAIEQIGHLESELGREKFAVLRTLADHFHEEFFKLAQAMNAEGMIPAETWNIVQGNKSHYAAFVPLEYVDTFVSSGIRKQIGTLKDVQNPYISTVLKGITTIRAIEINKVKRRTIEGLRNMFPDEILPAKMAWDGKRMAPVRPRDPEQEIMTVAQGGVRVSYYVPAEISEMFEHSDHSLLAQVAGPLDWVWRNVFYPVFISYNPVFQFIRNPIRDARRTSLNLPHGVGVEQAAIMRVTNAKAVRQFVEHGLISPDIAAALEARAFTPPQGTWQATTGATDEFLAIARRFGLAPEVKGIWDRSALLRPIAALGERIKIAGEVRELVPKLGTYKILTSQLGWGPEEAAFFTRNHVGTPNYTKQGTVTRVANDIFPFTNVFLKGWQGDLRLMRKGFAGRAGAGKTRKSAASWWMRWMLTSGSLRVLQAAGAAGVLGVGIKKLYDRVGDYYMSNYDVLPVGDTDGGSFDGKKTTMVILPRDPTDRIMGALTYQISKAIFETALGKQVRPEELVPKGFSFVSSDVPGLNPALKIASGWADFVRGNNPYDSFRSAPVLSQQEQRVGGWPAVKTMLAWTLGQTGVNSFVQYDPKSGSRLEIGVGLIPGINGLVRVTDNGLREQLASDKLHKEQVRDRAALAMPGLVKDLHQEYNYLSSVGAAARTPVMEARFQTLSGWESSVYMPFVEAAAASPRSAGRMGETAASLSKPFKRVVK